MMVLSSAVIGVGNSGPHHLSALHRNPRTEVTAVCDLNEDLASEYANEYDAESYQDASALIEEIELDWAHICTPVQSHLKLASLFLEEGIPILIQKPITTNYNEFKQLSSKAEKENVQVSVVHNQAFSGLVRDIRKNINSGYFGDVTSVSVITGDGHPDDTPRGSWVFDLPGGELEEGFPHPIYLALIPGGYPKNKNVIQTQSRLMSTYEHKLAYDGAQIQYTSVDDILCNIQIFTEPLLHHLLIINGNENSVVYDLNNFRNMNAFSDGEPGPADLAMLNIKSIISFLEQGISQGRNFLEYIIDEKFDRHNESSMSGTYYQINETAKSIINETEPPVPLDQAKWTVYLTQSIRDTVQD